MNLPSGDQSFGIFVWSDLRSGSSSPAPLAARWYRFIVPSRSEQKAMRPP
jgi:hypothetical protein